jgi:hypothetical protein
MSKIVIKRHQLIQLVPFYYNLLIEKMMLSGAFITFFFKEFN